MSWDYEYWRDPGTLYQATRTTQPESSWSSYTAHANIRAQIYAGGSIKASTMDSINYLTSTFGYHQHNLYDLANITAGGFNSVPTTTTDHWEYTGYPWNGSGYMYTHNISNPCGAGVEISTASVNALRTRILQVREHHTHYWYDDSYI